MARPGKTMRLMRKSKEEIFEQMHQLFEKENRVASKFVHEKKFNEALFCRIAYYATSRLGATIEDIATFFNIAPRTFSRWMEQYPAFAEVIQKGRDEYDTENVESTYLKRALGYEFEEKTYKRGKNLETGKMEMLLDKKVVKHVIPDVKALEGWLATRHRDRWGALRDWSAFEKSTEDRAEEEKRVAQEIDPKNKEQIIQAKEKERESILHILQAAGALDVMRKTLEDREAEAHDSDNPLN